MNNSEIIPAEVIESKIFLIRGMKVILDKDIAKQYGVVTGRLNEQVKRNRDRFPTDFMFQLNKDEFDFLISQSAISKGYKGGTRKLLYAFTERELQCYPLSLEVKSSTSEHSDYEDFCKAERNYFNT